MLVRQSEECWIQKVCTEEKKEYDAGPAFSHTVLGGVCR